MINHAYKLLPAVAALLFAIAWPGSVHAGAPATDDSSIEKINAANQMVRDGDPEQAIEMYAQIEPNDVYGIDINYNLAVAHYRNGDIDTAASLFADVANSSDEKMASNSRYNLGNCSYAKALQIKEQDTSAAIEYLRKAIVYYRGSLQRNPNHTDARANIELALQLINDLRKQEEQQPDQDQDPQQDQDQQQNHDQQGRTEQEQQGQQQDDQQQDDQQQDGKQSAEGHGSESNDRQSTERNAQHDSQRGETESGDPVGDEMDSDSESQDTPMGDLTTAGEPDKNNKPSGAVVSTGSDDREGPMTKEEAMKMLQAVRDRDMLRRLRHQQRERLRHVPVDRDW